MKKFFKINVLLLWIFIIYVVTLPISIPVTNDIIAANVERKLKKTDLPPNTKLCDSTSIAGRFTGNGNGMEFFGAILIDSKLSLMEIENYYSKFRKNEWSYIVEPLDNKKNIYKRPNDIQFDYLEGKEELSSYYVVYSQGSSKYPLSDLDIRGH